MPVSADGASSKRCAATASTARLTLIGDETHAPYDRPPLSKQVLAGKWDVETRDARDPRDASPTTDVDACDSASRRAGLDVGALSRASRRRLASSRVRTW